MSLTCKVPKLRFKEFSGEWEEKQLGTLCKLKAGKFVSASEISEKQEYEMFPCYGGNGLRGYVRTQTHEGNYALIGRQGALCGNVQFTSGKFHATEHAVVVSQNEENDSLWLYYQLDRLNLNRYATGQAQPGLSVDVIEKVKTSIPSKPEQQKIAFFLSAVDTKIDQLTRKKELLEQYKKGVMQKIFSQEIRFKAYDGSEFSEWEEKKLSNVGQIIAGGTPETVKEEYWNGNIQWFTPTEIKNKYISSSKRTITELGLKKSSAKLLPIGTLLLSSRATVGEISIALQECTTNQGFQSIIVNEKNNNEFMYYWIKNNKKEFLKRSSGSTFLEISKNEISKIKLSLPSLKEQTKIANFLSAIDTKLLHVSKQLDAAKEFKKALLQQMFV